MLEAHNVSKDLLENDVYAPANAIIKFTSDEKEMFHVEKR